MSDNYSPKLLCVDDVDTNNFLIKAYLKNYNVEVFLAENGSDALSLISDYQFCIILLDIMMGDMSGFELAKEIRKLDNYKLVPIIFITAFYNDAKSILEGYKLGAIDFLIKPINQEIIGQKVRFFLELEKQKQAIINSQKEISFQAKLLQNVNDSIIYTDLDGIIQYVNMGTYYTFGYMPDNLLGSTLFKLFPEQHKDLYDNELQLILKTNLYQSVWQGHHSNGKNIWIDIKISLLYNIDKNPEGYIVVSKDITLRKKAEEEAMKSYITGEDNERKRIAYDLHDGLGQILTAAGFNFSSINEEIQLLSKEKQKEYNLGVDFLNKAINELRVIAHNLMPKIIENFGLITAVRSLIESTRKNYEVKIKFSENLGNKRFNPQMEINLYRITQEILNNAIKHSKASNINFQYQINDDEIIFTYYDNGVGFNYNKLKNKGEGLNNIKNRVKSMSGIISISSKKQKGTSISIEITLNKNDFASLN